MYVLSGVSKWIREERIFQIFLYMKNENQQHEIQQEISKRKKMYIYISGSKQTLTQNQIKREV